MKITIRQLRRIIKEEVQNSLLESYGDEGMKTIKRGGAPGDMYARDKNSLYVWTDEGDWQIMGPVEGTDYESLAPGKTALVPENDPVLIPAVRRLGAPPDSDRMRMPSGDPIYPGGGRGSRGRF